MLLGLTGNRRASIATISGSVFFSLLQKGDPFWLCSSCAPIPSYCWDTYFHAIVPSLIFLTVDSWEYLGALKASVEYFTPIRPPAEITALSYTWCHDLNLKYDVLYSAELLSKHLDLLFLFAVIWPDNCEIQCINFKYVLYFLNFIN